MRALDRKLLRDAWHYRSQIGAIAAVVASGIALFVSLRSMNGFLRNSRDRFYAEYRFADVFARVERAPLSVATRIAQLPGVAAVEPRVVKEVTLDVPRLPEPAVGRLVSIAVPRASSLNEVHVIEGRWPVAERAGEVISSAAFASANHLALGDSIGAVINGRWQWLHIVALGISPEYVYEVGSAAIFPDNRRFGVLWMGNAALAQAFDMRGAFNDLTLRLSRGANERSAIEEIDRVLRPYGGGGAYGRAGQTSDRFVSGEIEETQVTSILLPAIFLAVTAFLLHIVMLRLVGTQREQLAALKAFGYGNGAIGAHYLALAMVPVLIGSVGGAAAGIVFATRLSVVYGRFFQFPSAKFVPDWRVVATAIAIGIVAGGVGALGAVARTVKLPPAEAMRPEAPARFRRGLVERVRAFARVGPALRIVVRNLERRPVRAAFSVFGIALAGGLVITTLSLFDVIGLISGLQFYHVTRQDVAVGFVSPRGPAALQSLRRLPGVLAVEPYRLLPVRIRGPGRAFPTAIMGLPPDGELHRVLDRHRVLQRLPDDGILCSAILADVLGVKTGDSVVVESLEGKRPRRVLRVTGVSDDLLGAIGYMELRALDALAEGGPVISGANLRVDRRMEDSLFTELKRLPAVAGVSVRAAQIAGFRQTIAESFDISLYTTMAFACVIAFGVVYNGARVALSERGRELASLRVLGFTQREVTAMLLGEQAAITLAGLPVAVGVTYLLGWLISVRFRSELYRLPVVVTSVACLKGFAVIVAAAAASALAVRMRVARLDLVAVLKTRE